MCGFNGFLSVSKSSTEEDNLKYLKNGNNKITARGPDSFGMWSDSSSGIYLAHRRLSIVDTSSSGHQPMVSHSGRYIIAFNGEIYNHKDIRQQLDSSNIAPEWSGTSDTETLLSAIEVWGLKKALKKSVGMFALALWDSQTKVLSLARDRFGEKPLYYGWNGNTFLFGSELKALKCHPDMKKAIDRDALCLYFRYNNIPAPHSIYSSIKKLLPGSILNLSAVNRDATIKQYWSSADLVKGNLSSASPLASVSYLDDLLKDAVGQQMIADVPLGAFLSGGVDSSVVVALMQSQSTEAVKTFSIGFHDSQYNEAGYAKSVAEYLGTDHSELYVTSNDSIEVISELPRIYDEPFADSSQIPTFLVSKLAKASVSVSLSGDAGDEVFGGYNRYKIASENWGKIEPIPLGLRNMLACSLTKVTPDRWNKIIYYFRHLLPNLSQQSNIGNKIHKAASVISSTDSDDLYENIVSIWNNPSKLVINGNEPGFFLTELLPALEGLGVVEKMMMSDLLSYLPDDILCKVDRASMAVSLETRVPFLDHRVVEYAWALPGDLKLREGQTKWVLRQVLYNYVPRELIERPKMGFAIPIGSWLRGPLKEWAEELLAEHSLNAQGYLNAGPIRKIWKEHLDGHRNWEHQLWTVLMFQAWLRDLD